MKIKTFTIIFFIILSNLKTNAELANSGMSFLQISSSAASAAAVNVFAQSARSPLAIFDNPVGIINDKTTFSLSHHFWFSDISLDALAFSIPLKNSSIGFGLNYVRIPGVEIRDVPSDEPVALVEPQYISAALAYTWSPISKISVGVTGKYLHEHLYTYTDQGIALDVAARWDAPSMLDLSIMLKNIGTLDSDIDANKLPTTLTIGIVRPELFEGEILNAAIGINLGTNLFSEEAFAKAGINIEIWKLLAIRGGFAHIGSENRQSIGFGIKSDRFGFDYAYLFMPEGLNNPHILTISYQP